MIAYCALFLALGLSASSTPLSAKPAYSEFVPDSRIISGWEAREGQFPYQLGLRLVNAAAQIHACGASLIHAEWALTAAHCVSGRIHIIVTAGSTSFSRPGVLLDTYDYVTHPRFDDDQADRVQTNDIALIKFQRAIAFTDRIRPIRLQSSADKDQNYNGVRLQASGWGTTATGGFSPDTLNWVYLRGITNWNCMEAYGFNPIIQPSTICTTGYNYISQSTCHGDNGSPLAFVNERGVPTQIGVSSFLPDLGCHLGIPAGFVRPGHYHDWYRDVTGIDFDWEPEAPSSEESSSEESSSSESSSSESSSSESSSSESSSSESSSSESSSSESSSSESSSSESSSSESSSSESSSSESSSSESSSSESSSSESSSSESSSSESSSSESSSSESSSSESSSSESSSSESSSSEERSEGTETISFKPTEIKNKMEANETE